MRGWLARHGVGALAALLPSGAVPALLLGIEAAEARVPYDPILEWNGPYFSVGNAATVDQLVNNPPIDIPFSAPSGVAARDHSSRDVVYVVDTGHSRVQAFEVNATYLYRDQLDFTWTDPVSGAGQWDSDEIQLPEWGASATRFLVPRSELLWVNGVRWTRVASLTGFSASDHVYTIDDSDASGAPEILLPANALTSSSKFALRYILSDEHTGASASFGIGDVDYGVGAAASPVLVTIGESSGGPSAWQNVVAIAASENEVTATSDDLFLLDDGDISIDQNEELFQFRVADDGTVTYIEAYDDYLATPGDVAVARSAASTPASATLSSDLGPFDQASLAIADASQVTGHTYDITVALNLVTITDRTTGRVLVSGATLAELANPFLGIPGLSLPLNGAMTASSVLTTTAAVSHRYLFVADTGEDRIKVIAAGDGASADWPGDWLPGDAHTPAAQPTGAGSVGLAADVDYRYTTPSTTPEDYVVFTNAAPIKETSLQTITFDPGGTPDVWTVTTDLSSATSSAKVFEIDWQTGRILFGDGVHGRIPSSSTQFQFSYSTTPDVLHYGALGDDAGEFDAPAGIAARWNASLGVYDLYVADTANDRIVKLAFVPRNTAQNLPARIDWITTWSTAASATDLLDAPADITVSADGDGVIWLAVADRGNARVVLYRDLAASTGGGTAAPTFDHALGTDADAFGSYQDLRGTCFLANGNDVDLFAVDAARGVVTKYEESPQPAIALDFTGPSALPLCFAPTGAYLFSFSTQNAPEGGWIDFYYDTVGTYAPATADLCLTSGTIGGNATQAVWSFDNSPGGTPVDHAGYYLYAVLRDSSGVEVAVDGSDADHLLCLDSDILPTVRIADALDGDRTLYLQNGVERTILLQVANPDSVVAAGFTASFDPDLIEILNVSSGNGWDGTGFTNQVFTSDADNETGTLQVNSSVTGAPIGLVTPGPHTLARVLLRARSDAVSTATRYRNGTLTLSTLTSGMSDIRNQPPDAWRASSLRLRLAYLGDLATDVSGADSTVPHLMPKPDGKINYADQLAFTLGWNGSNLAQDPIADLGPATGVAPDLVPAPDGQYDIEDILAFTTMYSWSNSDALRPADDPWRRPDLASCRDLTPPLVNACRPELLPGSPQEGTQPHPVTRLQSDSGTSVLTLDLTVQEIEELMGAQLILGFDPSALELLTVEDGGFLRGAEGGIFFRRAGTGWVEITSTRLDRNEPVSHGSGSLAHLRFRLLGGGPTELTLEFDLRGSSGAPIGRGRLQFRPLPDATQSFGLWSLWPNPSRGEMQIAYSLDDSQQVELAVFDSAGRKVRTLVSGRRPRGSAIVPFDGRSDGGGPLPAGVYHLRLGSGRRSVGKKLIWLR